MSTKRAYERSWEAWKNLAGFCGDFGGVRTRQKAAEAMGITVEALRAYEEGRRVPRDEVIFRAARYYGVSASQLLRTRSAGRAMPADHACPVRR